jgi:hypothetical protein
MEETMALDPVSLAASAAAFLIPYVTKAGETVAEKVGEKLPQVAGRVWNAIATRFRGRPAAEEAAADLVAGPAEDDRQAVFRVQLRKALEADPSFAEELAKLLSQAQKAAGDTITNAGSGAVATGGGVAAGAGGVAVGGSVHGDVVTGAKSTVFDQRGSTVGQQVNVAGDWIGRRKKGKDEGS